MVWNYRIFWVAKLNASWSFGSSPKQKIRKWMNKCWTCRTRTPPTLWSGTLEWSCFFEIRGKEFGGCDWLIDQVRVSEIYLIRCSPGSPGNDFLLDTFIRFKLNLKCAKRHLSEWCWISPALVSLPHRQMYFNVPDHVLRPWQALFEDFYIQNKTLILL